MYERLILGAGIAGLSLSSFLKTPSLIIEKEITSGGLCRSFNFNGIYYDIGPHIIFSKYQEVLELHNNMVQVDFHERLNRIFLHDHFVKYPFENHLGQLPDEYRDLCLLEFQNNPYKTLQVSNMHQFFLSKFGEGMTDLYFSPYNKKIWKYDTAALDLQMVERIPDPPVEDVVDGAYGLYKEGYTHQLKFSYPTKGGFQEIVDQYENKVKAQGSQILLNEEVIKIFKNQNNWQVETNKATYSSSDLISTIPLPNLIELLSEVPEEIINTSKQLKFNSIHIVFMQFQGDRLKDQFAMYIPDKDIIFHRLSRLNFLGPTYGENSEIFNVLLEITFRPNSHLSQLSYGEIQAKCLEGLEKLKIVNREDFLASEIRTFEHAYVIYDLDHRKTVDRLLKYLEGIGIKCHGRFGKFEYQNSDQVVKDSIELAEKININ